MQPTFVRATLFLALAAAPLGAQGACPSTPDNARASRELRGLVDSLLAANPDVPGIALAVLGPGGCVLFNEAGGVANRATRAPLTPEHPHRIASNTKTYTAAAILRLMELGKLALDDPMTRHLPAASLASLRRDGYDVDHITIRHLLNHTAGLYDYAMDPHLVAIVERDPTHRWTRAEEVDSAVAWGTAYNAPGQGYHYSDTGYILLGEIIERLTGQPMARAFRDLLHFDALGLTSTWLETMEPPPPGVIDRAHQYLGEGDTYGFDPSFDLYGGGGLAATPRDMARFTRALFMGGVYRDRGTIDVMMTVPPGIQANRTYGAGLYRQPVRDDLAGWGHSGFWNTFSFHLPGRDVTVAASITQQGRSPLARALFLGSVARVVR